MSKFTAGLNPEQRKAVETTEGPLLVLAGAGTGKTRVITHRIAHMLSKGVSPRSILAMTFTKKAAGEMKERIAKLVPNGGAQELTVGTFHSFAAVSLRQMADRVGVKKDFGICGEDDQLVAMKQALRELQIPEKTLQPRVCLSRVSLLKNKLTSHEVLSQSSDDWESMIGRAYQRYDVGLRTSGVLDFDDLLLYMVKLLQDKKTLKQFQDRYRYLFIDEYQDTNGPQYEIVRLIGAAHRNVCVVGDDDQSIYGWRGADISKILNFDKDFPEATVVRLEANYRSTPQIIAGANAVIRNNTARHDKALRAEGRDGEQIIIRKLKDEDEEALYVVEDIIQRQRDRPGPLGDFAILFRTAIQPRVFELQLRQHSIPYILVGGMSFFDRKEVKDILSFLRLVANPSDELSLLRIINTPPRGIGGTSVEKMLDVAARQRLSLSDVIMRGDEFPELQSSALVAARRLLESLAGLRGLQGRNDLVELVKQLIPAVNYGEEIARCYPDPAMRTKRWDAVNEIMNMAESHTRHRQDATLISFLEDVTLNAQDADEKEETRQDKMTLMTLHSAKGLEFSEVYLVGVEEGLLPHSRSLQEGTLDEERRLAYVGITRAKKRLTMTYVTSRAHYGQRVAATPSRFLYEMRGKVPPPEIFGKPTKVEEEKPAKPAATTPKSKSAPKTAAAKPKAPPDRRRGKWAQVAKSVRGSGSE